MAWVAVVIGGAVLLFVLFMVAGILHLRKSIRNINEALDKVSIDDVPGLAEECIRVFKEKYNIILSFDDMEGSVKAIDHAVRSDAIKDNFATPELFWYFVKPTGAFIGELIRRNAPDAQWQPDEKLGGLKMVIMRGGEEMITYPFHKMIKEKAGGNEGDLYMYVLFSLGIEHPSLQLIKHEGEVQKENL